LVSIHSAKYGSSHSFTVGRVLYVGADQFALQRYSAEGLADGIYIADISEIRNLEINSRYMQRLHLLIDKMGSIVNKPRQLPNFTSGDLFYQSLVDAMKGNEVVSVLVESWREITGYVKGVNTKILKLQEILHDGTEEGLNLIQLDTIERLVAGGIEETKCHIFHENQDNIRKYQY